MRVAESGNAKPDNEQGAHALIALIALGNSFGKSVSILSALGNSAEKVRRRSTLPRWREFSPTGKRSVFVIIAGAAGGLGATRVRKARANRKSEFWLVLRVRSHMATYPSNRATVARLLRRCKSFGTR